MFQTHKLKKNFAQLYSKNHKCPMSHQYPQKVHSELLHHLCTNLAPSYP